ncbi:MAG: hypothetical protein V4792_16610 [Pseudomonadota bacterium]
MAANTSIIWPRSGDVQSNDTIIGPSANTAQDGTGANIYSVWQADATEGGLIEKIVFRAVGSPAGSVARIYVCNVTGAFTPGTSNTAATAWLVDEVTLPSVSVSQTAAAVAIESVLNIQLPAGYRILVSFGSTTGAAGTGYRVTGVGGKY